MNPYIKVAATKGWKTVINPVWLHTILMKLPWELWNPDAHDKKAIAAWIHLVHEVAVRPEDLPEYLT